MDTRRTALFALYLLLLINLILFFYTGAALRKHLPVFLKNFPQVTFEKGVLTQPQAPVFAPIPNTEFKIVFDAAAKMPPSNEELLKSNTLAWIHNAQAYIPSASGLQIQQLPENLNFTSDPQTLEKHRKNIYLSLRATLLVTSLVMSVFLLLFDFCLALGILLFFNIWRGRPLSKGTLIKLAVFLLGPLSTLFLLRLWIYIPLFALAQGILCVIYTQQIFNTIPEKA